MTGVFTIPDEELQNESWRIMLHQESEEEKFEREYQEKQKKIIQEIFGE